MLLNAVKSRIRQDYSVQTTSPSEMIPEGDVCGLGVNSYAF